MFWIGLAAGFIIVLIIGGIFVYRTIVDIVNSCK